MSGPLAARLITMGVEVLADTTEARAFDDLRDLIVYAGGGDQEAGLREVLRMLADAADSACEHSLTSDGPWAISSIGETFDRMIGFAGAIRSAMKEVSE